MFKLKKNSQIFIDVKKITIKINKHQAKLIIYNVPKGKNLKIKGDAWNYIFDIENKKILVKMLQNYFGFYQL